MQQLPKSYNYTSVSNVNYNTTTDTFKRYANKTAVLQENVLTVRPDGTSTQKVVTYNLGVLTGVTATGADGEPLVQYIYNDKIYYAPMNGVVTTGTSTKYVIKAESAAQQLIESNKAVLEDLLLASEFVARLERKGYNCNQYREEIKNLYARWENRQNYLIGYSDNTKYTEPHLLSNALENIVNGAAIGIAVTTVIVLSVVITGVVSALAWFVFYTYGGQAKSDCRKSKELNKILSNVDPQTREELYNYIDKYADSFYKKAVRRTKAENLFSNTKLLLVAGGAGYLVYKYFNNND